MWTALLHASTDATGSHPEYILDSVNHEFARANRILCTPIIRKANEVLLETTEFVFLSPVTECVDFATNGIPAVLAAFFCFFRFLWRYSSHDMTSYVRSRNATYAVMALSWMFIVAFLYVAWQD